MTLLFSMIPFYLLGNLHCLGMCGPLVMTIGASPNRMWYFFGRMLSFTLAGGMAGAIGAVLGYFLKIYHIPALTCFLFGAVIMLIGWQSYTGVQLVSFEWMRPISNKLATLALSSHPFSIFLFGFFTVLLPCGQTIVVFSACAIAGELKVGLMNGAAFALLTSPSLLFAMHSYKFLNLAKKSYNSIFSFFCLLAGSLSICRGLAELEWIPHLEITNFHSSGLHLVIF